MASLRTKAAVALARVPISQGEKAIRANVTRRTVNRWETGATRPTAAERAKILALWGIPDAAWELMPDDPDPPGMPTPAPPSDSRELEDDELGAASMSVEGRVDETERAIRRLMTDALGKNPDSTPRERAYMLETLVRMLGAIAKMKGTFEKGGRLFKLPVYQLLEDTLLEVLKPCPSCARRVAEAMAKLEEEHGR